MMLALAMPIAYTCYGQVKTDPVAENMLVYQRNAGGWPKMVNEINVDYAKALTAGERKATLADAIKNDATIDNEATFKELNYLVKAYAETRNENYLHAAEKGIRYLLKAQNANGGWPQYYPDASGYRGAITFNDNAMIHVMTVLDNVARKANGFSVVDQWLAGPSALAVKRGITCILKTQLRGADGKLTGWNQQYDKNTLQPISARKFELVGVALAESAEIVRFLMKVPDPSPEIKLAVKNAAEWLEGAKIPGFRFDHIADPSQAGGKDAVLLADRYAAVWARFYDIDTNKPFFAGRDGKKKFALTEIEVERRVGYAWYGVWPQQLLQKEYPLWAKKNLP